MDTVNLPLLAGATLIFIGVLAGLFTSRLGLSFLLVFILTGIMAGEDGLGGFRFDNYWLSFWVGNVALAIILLDGGLRTAYATFRTGLRPAALLATVGVLMTAGITAAAAVWLLDLSWPTALLLGAIVGSTDAAAVFSLMSRSGVRLNERVFSTLEIESGMNDPMAIYLTLSFIALVVAPQTWGVSSLTLSFIQQFGWGCLIGVAGGALMAALLARIAQRDAGGSIMALLIGAGGLMVFAATGLMGGSGFLAVYLFGLVLANRAAPSIAPSLAAMDGFAWLGQAGMFLLLGLLVTPSKLVDSLGASLTLSAVLILVARPVAVWLCLMPWRFSARETWFISWVGLRGAVPIVLALFPLMAGLPQADLLFNVAFVVVLTSLLFQGSSIAWVARRLGVTLPDDADENAVRVTFKDFSVDPQALVGDLCAFYELDVPSGSEVQSVGNWMSKEIGRPPIAGDTVDLGTAKLVVRSMQDGRIAAVGLGLEKKDVG